MRRLVGLLVAFFALVASASAAPPGPPLKERAADLAASLECSAGVAAATPDHPPVILVHGTTSSPEDSWSWGYRRVLPALGYPTCTVRLPGRATVDMQRSAEYVVNAIRTVSAQAPKGVKVDLLGHSQGAFLSIYTEKFWPDLHTLVGDIVALSGAYREADGVQLGCNPAACSPPFRQRQKGAKFMGAFIAAPLPTGPSYTSILTLDDEVTKPQPVSSTLTGPDGADIRNVTLQDVCPGRTTEHLMMISDAVVYQLVLDAFTHPGTADPARITPDCGASSFAGIDQGAFTTSLASSAAGLVTGSALADQSPTEPPVRCYLQRDCASVDERGAMLTAASVKRARLTLTAQVLGKVRVTIDHGPTQVKTFVRALPAGRRTVALPRLRTGRRYMITIETLPGTYTKYLVERRLRYLRR